MNDNDNINNSNKNNNNMNRSRPLRGRRTAKVQAKENKKRDRQHNQ